MQTSSLKPYLVRTHMISAMRQFFDELGLVEVITPVFNEALPVEPNLYSFSSDWHTRQGDKTLYLSVSPESSLKKMMAAGIGDCYAIGKCFRNLESHGDWHNPEFLMVEWYRQGADYHQIMAEVKCLISSVQEQLGISKIDTKHEWPTISLVDAMSQWAGIELATVWEDEQLTTVAAQKGYSTAGASWDQLFDQIFLNEIEPHLPSSPFFLIDFPARTSPLCAVASSDPHIAQRFELYIDGHEIANGNTENINADEVSAAFTAEQQLRHQHQLPSHPADTAFVDALRQLQPMAGIGLGVDRLAMILSGADSISEVEPFAIKQ